jgi:hypothetical protein
MEIIIFLVKYYLTENLINYNLLDNEIYIIINKIYINVFDNFNFLIVLVRLYCFNFLIFYWIEDDFSAGRKFNII